MGLWVWRDLRYELPDDWEMLQFSRNYKVGRCAFADRFQFRFEINWRQTEGPPDFDRMMSDYRAKLINDEQMQNVRETEVAGWRGLEGYTEGILSSRFGNYIKGQSCVIEAVFLWPEKADVWLMRSVLSSIGENVLNEDKRRWKAFGLDVMSDASLEMTECLAEPANARMVFSDRKEECSERYSRLGMVKTWLGGTVKEWLRDQRPNDIQGLLEERTESRGHVVDQISGEKRALGVGGLLNRKLRYDASAWICPADKRLYSVALTRRPGDAGEKGETRLSCCAGMGHGIC